MSPIRWRGACGVAAALVLLAACDTAPGPDPLGERPPVVSSLEIDPARISFDELDPGQIEGDQARIPVTISVVARGQSSPVREVVFVIQDPSSAAEPLASGTLAAAGGDRYSGTAEIVISALDPAQYPVVVAAVDEATRLSGEIRGQVRYTREFEPGAPPTIDEVVVPDTLQRPAAGQPPVTLAFVAVVSDPDGLANVQKVEFWNVTTPTQRLLMCDDGGGQPCGAAADSGDETAGDGRYTLTVFVSSDNSPGVNTFAFQATDRAGLTSNVVEKSITVE